MSRIGKLPVTVPGGVTVAVDGQNVSAKGPKGELAIRLVDAVTASMGDGGVKVEPVDHTTRSRAMWGMSRTMIANIVEGVSSGFVKKLEINGVGYRATMKGKDLQLQLGFSHDVIYKLPEGVEASCPSQTAIEISGIDKQKVGQVAAEIRKFRPPEPYKGKCVKYEGEYIFRKEGKKK
jgi:large subunit ribosomal protein L6